MAGTLIRSTPLDELTALVLERKPPGAEAVGGRPVGARDMVRGPTCSCDALRLFPLALLAAAAAAFALAGDRSWATPLARGRAGAHVADGADADAFQGVMGLATRDLEEKKDEHDSRKEKKDEHDSRKEKKEEHWNLDREHRHDDGGDSPEVVPDQDQMWQSMKMMKSMEKQADKSRDEAELIADKHKSWARLEDAHKAESRRRKEHEAEEAAKAEKDRRASKTLLLSVFDSLAEGYRASRLAAASVRDVDGFYLLRNGSCADVDLFPIDSGRYCAHAAEVLALGDAAVREADGDRRPAGCYARGARRDDGVAAGDRRLGATADAADGHVGHPVCQDDKRKSLMHAWLVEDAEAEALARKREEAEHAEQERKRKKEQAEQDRAERAIKQWDEDEERLANISLYCFSLMMPFGYEADLLREQQRQKVGIFACEEFAVFSNTTTEIGTGKKLPVEVTVIPGSLAVVFGGKWMTALNTGVFNRLWMQVVTLGDYRYHDWAVKVDPDAVFFPGRLRQVLRHRTTLNDADVQRQGRMPKQLSCGSCKLKGKEGETCASHVKAWQRIGRTCRRALELVSREAPEDCGCKCDDFACDFDDGAMYLNNCKWGLHGPIEVLSRRAVATYAAGLPKCVPFLSHPWGEDKFLDKCMQHLGVTRVNEYSLLSETACGEQPAPCGTSKVAFHPFKSIDKYFSCHDYARKYGDVPAERPALPEADQESDPVHFQRRLRKPPSDR